MRKLRDVFYVNADFENNCFTCYELLFSEFIQYCPDSIDNILLLDPMIRPHPVNQHLFMTTLNRDAINEMSKQDVYEYGDFLWMDYRDEESLNRCTEQEKAEILYLSKYWVPLKSPFFNSIGNRYVYLAHDDGWLCKLYCRDKTAFIEFLANKITGFFATNKRRKLYPIGEEIKTRLLEWAGEGLLIDFRNAVKRGSYQLSFSVIGKFIDMDEMYHTVDSMKNVARKGGWMEMSSKRWKMECWDRQLK